METNSVVRSKIIDYMKGIGIVLVVLAHAGIPYSGFIDLFHMPFFLSFQVIAIIVFIPKI